MNRKKYWIGLLLFSCSMITAQSNSKETTTIWEVNNLTNIGGYPVTVFGNPAVKESSIGKYVEFDGVDDGLIVNGCPINNESSFTVELIFKPHDSFPNNVEQRFFHMQKPKLNSRRLMVELRLTDKNEWFTDTHIHADDKLLTCLAKEFPHPVNQWFHVAVVYKDGLMTHYINGQKEMSGAVQYIPVDSASVALGMRMNKVSYFKGDIYSVSFSNYELSQSNFVLSSKYESIKKLDAGNSPLYSDDFNSNTGNWISEFENPSTSKISIANGRLDLKSSAGATVWYKNKLSGNLVITYDVTAVDSGGVRDRVSDLNAFWMATDPANQNLFTRDGKFTSYDNLSLYYAGVGGHDNETTRFRKYSPTGDKPVIKEYLDKEHLLKGNEKYSIKIIVLNGITSYYLNDKLYFDYTDNSPLTEGYFGFRTTRSHQIIKNFKVARIF